MNVLRSVLGTEEVSQRTRCNFLMEWLDDKAGRWRLTDLERHIQIACRERFGFYQPDSHYQADYIDKLLGKTVPDEKPALAVDKADEHVEPSNEVWQQFFSNWRPAA